MNTQDAQIDSLGKGGKSVDLDELIGPMQRRGNNLDRRIETNISREIITV